MRAVIAGPEYSGKTTLFDAFCSSVSTKRYRTRKEQLLTVTLEDERLRVLQGLTGRPKAVFPTYTVVDVLPTASDAERIAIWRTADVLLCVLKAEATDDPKKRREDFIRRLVELDVKVALPRYEQLKVAVEKGGPRLKENHLEMEALEPCVEELKAGRPLTALKISDEWHKVLSHFSFLTLKRRIWVVNLPDDMAHMSGYNEEMGAFCIAALLENELSELSDEEKEQFMGIYGLKDSKIYPLLRYIFFEGGWILFFTVGDDEVRAWAVKRGTTAFEAAGKIHTDIQKGFIKAEVIPFNDYVEWGGRDAAQYAGKMRLEGADYTIKDGDVVQFRFSK